ncbi:MAG: KAP family P-loop NTPase fold protein [Parashewanella sp.]
MSKTTASRYEEWQEQYNWASCRANREEYGKFLLSVLTSKKNGFVLNLNGEWGTGKTEFLRRLYVELAEQKYPVVYIDAWESDFVHEPLVVICTEILNQLAFVFEKGKKDGRKRGLLKKLSESEKQLHKGLQYALSAGKFATLFTGDSDYQTTADIVSESRVLLAATDKQKDVNQTNLDLIERVTTNQNQLVQAMKDIREQITLISELLTELYGLKTPIVFLIDELDRCRPDYAIKMLEIVKHFFDVKGCAFLIATDTNSLEKSIKAIYGSEFDSPKYLKRFFHQKINLPEPSVLSFIQSRNLNLDKYQQSGLRLFPFENNEKLITIISAILDHPEITLRCIEQILHRLIACLDYISSNLAIKPESINIAVLVYGLFEQHLDLPAFNSRHNKDPRSLTYSGRALFEVNLEDFISSQMQLVTKAHSEHKHTFYGTERPLPRKAMKMLTISSNELDHYSRIPWSKINMEEDLSQQISIFESNEGNYWLWENYQKLIGLTAHIE